MSIFWLKNVGKIQSTIDKPKIDTPKIDTYFKFRAHTKCVNLWRKTVNVRCDITDNENVVFQI